MEIYRLIYRSTATRPLDSAELERLVSQCQIYNFSHHVTGVLFYSGQQFLQELEGPRNAVEEIYEHLSHDARHTELFVIDRAPAPQRMFPSWSMGFGEVDARALARLSNSLDPKSRQMLLPSTCDPQGVITELLQEFVEQQLLSPVRSVSNGRTAGAPNRFR